MSRTAAWIRGHLLVFAVCAGLAASGQAHAREDAPRTFVDAVSEISGLLSQAHFQTAKSVAEATLSWADGVPEATLLRAPRSQLHVLLATAQVALGEHKSARESMRLALALDPTLALDTQTTSPKVVRVLREARQRPTAGSLRQ